LITKRTFVHKAQRLRDPELKDSVDRSMSSGLTESVVSEPRMRTEAALTDCVSGGRSFSLQFQSHSSRSSPRKSRGNIPKRQPIIMPTALPWKQS